MQLKKSLPSQFVQFIQDRNLLSLHTDYTRFIILGRSRSGSNFLRGLLNAHTQIIVFEEMFKNPDTIGWGLEGYPQGGRALQRFQSDPAQFVDQDVFKKLPQRIKAVGFKIFYYHAYGTSLEPIWDYLREHNEIRVLHLKRENILKTHLSKKRAELTDSWINLTGKSEHNPKITLDFDECLEVFEQTREWEHTYDEFFTDHPKLELYYEKLARDYETQMKSVEEFLGVDYEAVQPQTYKQTNYPISDSIANYSELKHKFAGTPWEEFFKE